MWIYQQSTGTLRLDDGTHIADGYSGKHDGKNNPAKQDVRNVGPIPRGVYTLGEPVDTLAHGPYVLTLTPDADNRMYGRSGFLIHGDSKAHAGDASEGCIVIARTFRELVARGPDKRLIVIA